jgi:hypothetical protein
MSEQSFEETVRPSGVLSPQEIHAAAVAEPGIPAAQVETLEEVGPRPVQTVLITMGNGVDLRVPMQAAWRKSAIDFLRTGDFDSWAEAVLDRDALDLWDEWMDTDPLGADLTDFVYRLGKATGEAATGNRASRRSSERRRGR